MKAKYFWPAAFVLMWSSGPSATKLALADSTPFALLSLRSGVATLILLAVLIAYRRMRAAGPLDAGAAMQAAGIGLLVHALYLGTAFYALAHGISASLSALLSGMQPVSTALLALIFLGERMSAGKALGILVGCLGVVLFTAGDLSSNDIPLDMFILHAAGVVCLSAGLVIQKRVSPRIGFLESTTFQYMGATVLFSLALAALETPAVTWTPQFTGAFLWLLFVLSIGAVLVLMFLLGRDDASRTSSLFFLMPATAAFISALVLGETPTPLQAAGLVVSGLGVAVVMRSGRKTPAAPRAAPAPQSSRP